MSFALKDTKLSKHIEHIAITILFIMLKKDDSKN